MNKITEMRIYCYKEKFRGLIGNTEYVATATFESGERHSNSFKEKRDLIDFIDNNIINFKIIVED